MTDEQAQKLEQAVQGVRDEIAALGRVIAEASDNFAKLVATVQVPRPSTVRVSAPVREPVRPIRPRRSDDTITPA